MASLCSKGESKYIVFYREKKRQPLIFLGNVSDRIAEKILGHVEDLIAAKNGGVSVTAATSTWLTKINSELSIKLVNAGLVERLADVSPVATLDDFIKSYIADRTDIKDSTRYNLDMTRRNLVEFFGPDRPLPEFTPGDADEWRRWLGRSEPSKPGEPRPPSLDKNTIRRRCGRAKQFFRAAKNKRLLGESPFKAMKDCHVGGNKSRDYFITREQAAKVLATCQSVQWQLVFALGRYGGLRCPSEHARLRWLEVDWKGGRFLVHSPKTEGHDGMENREVPIFAELRPYLESAYNEAANKTGYVITLPGIHEMRVNGKNANLSSTLLKIIKRAGLEPWPKLMHNLRASRQTELTDRFPEHVVCAWLGNSRAVAREHYLRPKPEHFEQAAAGAQLAAQEDAQVVSTSMRQGCTPDIAESGLLLQTLEKALEKCNLEQVAAVIGKSISLNKMTPTGQDSMEQLQENSRKRHYQYAPEDAQIVNSRWKKLPARLRQFICLLASPG